MERSRKADRAEQGANLGCDWLLRQVHNDLKARQGVEAIQRNVAEGWLRGARQQLECEAAKTSDPLRAFACTVLLAVIGKNTAAFLQLGDGAIVLADDAAFRTVFWPQNGEYANETFFLTDPDAEQRMEFLQHPGQVRAIALLTDGLQRVGADYARAKDTRPFSIRSLGSCRKRTTRKLLLNRCVPFSTLH